MTHQRVPINMLKAIYGVLRINTEGHDRLAMLMPGSSKLLSIFPQSYLWINNYTESHIYGDDGGPKLWALKKSHSMDALLSD